MRKYANPLKYINPFYTLISDKPTKEDMMKNLLGVTALTVPTVALATYIANTKKMRDMKRAISKNTEAQVNGSTPILQLDDVKGNIDKRNKKELNDIRAALGKQANSGDSGILSEWGKEILLGTIPALSVPLMTWLTAKATNTVLKDKYESQLDEENRSIQDMQDRLDMDTLARVGYIRRKNMQKNASLRKESAYKDYVGDGIRALSRLFTGGVDTTKKIFVTIPGSAMLLAALGLGGFGALHYLKKSDDVQKLKLLEERMLGKDQTLQSPELLIDIPEDYEETGKTTAQLIPGISPALIPNNVVEDAVVVEKPKKDVFLG
jgi:hypothetical protein